MATKLVNGQPVEMTAEEIAALEEAAAAAQAMQAENVKTVARGMRDSRLAACDWTQTADCPLSKEQKTAWGKYRMALRDVPSQAGFPDKIEWPAEPA